MPNTKIVCTIGPSSGSKDVIRELIRRGMSVARLNFSHGTWEEHREKLEMIRSASAELNRPTAILQDLCGPKIRVGRLPPDGIMLTAGNSIVLTSRDVDGSDKRVSVSYQGLPSDVKVGDRILLADGMMELVVKSAAGTDIHCEVIHGGVLTSFKGINLPTGTIKAEALTEKDKADLRYGLSLDVDYAALSFVRSADDIIKVKDIIAAAKKNTPVIAKIEKHEALENIDEIMKAADGVMVARGDLGVEIPLEKVPNIQKRIIRKANALGKPVIIATQMLRSMVGSVRPTRAEATDVANAVIDGADAVMLSEETASGNFPLEAVRVMARIAETAEQDFPHEKYLQFVPKEDISESVSHAACVLADHLKASAVVATTRSGFTAMQISRFRPKTKLIALSPEVSTVRRLALYWGCIPSLTAETRNTDEHIEASALAAAGAGNLAAGDIAVFVSGHPVWVSGTTNLIRVKTM